MVWIFQKNTKTNVNQRTLIKSLRPNFLFGLFESTSVFELIFTFGIANNIPMALKKHQIPTTKNGKVNPPASYSNEPNAGPKKYTREQKFKNSKIALQ